MYNASSGFASVVNSDSRTFYARLTSIKPTGNVVVTDGIKSIKYENSSCTESDFTLGSVSSSYIEVTMVKNSDFRTGRELFFELGLEVNGAIEYIPMGYFTPDEVSFDESFMTFNAYDRMMKTEKLFAAQDEPKRISWCLGQISNICNIPVNTSVENDYEITIQGGYTCRETLQYISQICGGFAVIDRSGILQIKKWANTSVEIGRDRYFTIESGNYYHLHELSVSTGKNEDGTDAIITVTDGTVTPSDDNAIMSFFNPYFTEAIANTVFEKIPTDYYPTNLSILGDPRFDVWDIFEVSGIEYTAGSYTAFTRPVAIMSLKHSFDGGLTTDIESIGKTNNQDSISYRSPSFTYKERVSAELAIYDKLIARKIDASVVEANYVTTKKLESEYISATTIAAEYVKADKIESDYLSTDKLIAKISNTETAWITTGMLGEAVVESTQIADGSITDAKIVTLHGNKIEAGTLYVDRLLVLGDDDNYHFIQVPGEEGKPITSYTLSGKEIADNTITADKIVTNSITAEKLDITDIFSNHAVIEQLFANNITATGKISGLTIEGVKGNIGGWYIYDKELFGGTNTANIQIISDTTYGSSTVGSPIIQLNKINTDKSEIHGEIKTDSIHFYHYSSSDKTKYDFDALFDYHHLRLTNTYNGETIETSINPASISTPLVSASDVHTPELTIGSTSNGWFISSGVYDQYGDKLILFHTTSRFTRWIDPDGTTNLLTSWSNISDKPNLVNSVKGSAESTYRTGNVSLTAANVGALPVTGGYVTNGTNEASIGAIYNTNGRRIYLTASATVHGIYSFNENGEGSYVLRYNATNKNFDFYGNASSASSVAWGDVSGRPTSLVNGVKGSAETNYRTGNVNLTASNIGALPTTGGWVTNGTSQAFVGALYNNANPRIYLHAESTGMGIYAFDINGTGRNVCSYDATNKNFNFNGNATSATKATQDGSGNTITSTYLPFSGGTLTGNLTIGSASVASSTYQSVKAMNAGNNALLLAANGPAGVWHEAGQGSANKWLISINTSGTVTANTSDRRYKIDKGLLDASEAKTILSELDIINFVYKEDVDRNNLEQSGIYAQDLRDILLRHGYKNKNYLSLMNISNPDDADIYYDINLPESDVRYEMNYTALIPILIKGWQMHEARITELENRIKELTA